jgi:hypothetical protein
MPKPKMLKRVLRKEKEDRGVRAPVLLSALPGLRPLLRRLGGTSRGYALAGAGVVVGAVVVVSLLSWLAPDSDRPIGHPLETVGQMSSGVLEQVDDQVEALLGTDGETVLESVREGLVAARSATPWWPGNPAEIAASPYSGKASPDDPVSPTTDDAAAPTRGGSSSAPAGAPSQPAASSTPSTPSETPTSKDTPSSPVTSEPTPPTSEEPPVAEEPSTPPPAEEPPVAEEPAPPVEEPVPPPAEEPPPVAEEPPSAPSDPPPAEGPPQTIPGG